MNYYKTSKRKFNIKRRGASALPRDARMMHAWIWLAREIRTMPLLLLSLLPCLSKNFQTPRIPSLYAATHYRLEGVTIGRLEWPPASQEAIGHLYSAGRHYILPVGTKFLQRTVWQQQQTDSAWYGILSICKHGQCFLSCMGLKEAWPLVLGPSIMHLGAWWPKEPRLPFNVKKRCMQHTKWEPSPYHVKIKGPSDMRIEACFATWSTNTPHSSHLVWHPQTK